MAWRASHYAVSGALAAGALLWGAHEAWSVRRPLVARTLVVTSAYDQWTDQLRPRETPAAVLARAGIRGGDYVAFLRTATALDMRRFPAGFAFQFRRVKGDSVADQLTVRTSRESRVRVERLGGDSGWRQVVERIPWTATRVRASGIIETNLYDALDQAVADSVLPRGERVALAWEIAEVYQWEVDFTRIRPGARFDVLIERLESPGGERRLGRVLAARVHSAADPSYAFHFETQPGHGAFYDERGRSLRRAFNLYPIQYRRISSRFGGRYHPVLRTWRSHEGIDYAAAPGTPVRATAAGSVSRVGREGGYGNLVELRHVNGIRTRYGHLSRFATGLRVGHRVEQEQVVGYVGATGLVTGPHLHYEFLVNGRPTNPLRRDAGPIIVVPKALRAAFDSVRTRLAAELEPPAAAAEPTVAGRVD